MEKRKALGNRGMSALFGAKTVEGVQKSKELTEEISHSSTRFLPIDAIQPNPEQPRLHFDEEKLQELALSIKKEGILQPLIVCKIGEDHFELIAGERRLRAAKMAGLKEVPVIIREENRGKMLELAIIENIQRHDLNPLEEALAYQNLIDRFQISHADVAEYVGKSRGHVSHFLRLLKLPKSVQEDLFKGKLSVGHAKVLLNLVSVEEQIYFGKESVDQDLSVRELEEKIQTHKKNIQKTRGKRKIDLSPQLKLLLDEMEKKTGTKVRLQPGKKDGRGSLVIEYYSWQDLDHIYKKLTL